MKFITIVFSFLLTSVSTEPESDERSLVIIFDATASMHDDLVQLRSSAVEIINDLSAQEENKIKEYILVVFRDPGELNSSLSSRY
jgi:hypothetical protein